MRKHIYSTIHLLNPVVGVLFTLCASYQHALDSFLITNIIKM